MHYNKDTHNDIARTMQTMRDDYIGREQITHKKTIQTRTEGGESKYIYR